MRPPGPRRTTFPTSNHRPILVRRRSRGSSRGARRRAHRCGSRSAQPHNASASEPRDSAASPAFRCAEARAAAWRRGVRPPGPHRTTFPTSNRRPALVRRRLRGSPRGSTTKVRPNRAMPRRRLLSVARRHTQPSGGAACARQARIEPRSRRRTAVRPWFDVGSVVRRAARRAAAQRKCVRTARWRGVACFPLCAGMRNRLQPRPAHDDARRPGGGGGRQARSRRRVRKRGERGRRDASARGARPRSGHPRHRSPGCSRGRTAGTSR